MRRSEEHIHKIEPRISNAVEVEPHLLKHIGSNGIAHILQELDSTAAMQVGQTHIFINLLPLRLIPVLAEPCRIHLKNLRQVHGAPLFVDFPVHIVQKNVIHNTSWCRRSLVTSVH